MSEYSKISKDLGWGKREAAIPSIEKASELVKKAMNKDIDAFRELFAINRFAISPQNETEVKALNIVVEGFIASSKFWT